MKRAVAFVTFALAVAIPAGAQNALLHIDGDRAIVSDGARRTIEIHDLATGARLWSAPGPSDPRLIASSRGTAAVLDPVSSAAHVIDLERRTATPVRVPVGPVAAAFAEGHLFVLSGDAQRLTRIERGAVAASVALPRDPAFLKSHNDQLYVYSRGTGTLSRIDPRALRTMSSLNVGRFASDLEISGGIAYLVFPSEAEIVAVELSGMKEIERFRLGAVPIDLAVSGEVLAVADPASNKVWRTERTRSFSSAFVQGFLRGLIGLGVKPPVSPDFPAAVDRVAADGRTVVAFDSANGSLYRIADKPKLAATGVEEGSFALSGGRIFVRDSSSGLLRQIE